MISSDKIKRIRRLRKNGLSHREISRLVKISLGSVFNHTTDITLTTEQKYKLKMQGFFGAPKELRRAWSVKGGHNAVHNVKYFREDLLKKVLDFYKLNQRIPTKREFVANYGVYRRIFGTWNKAIIAAGFDPNPVMFAKKHIANDGHICDSLAEKIIDDWLFRRKIKHERNFPYPSNDKFTVDFKVDNYWIEFFGLSGELKRYDELKIRKLNLIKRLKLRLIEIYPKDLFPVGHVEDKLGFLI